MGIFNTRQFIVNTRPFIVNTRSKTRQNHKMKLIFTILTTPLLISANPDYGYEYESDSSLESTFSTTFSTNTDSNTSPENDFQLFEKVTEIIRHTKEEIENIKEHPFLAEEKAFEVLNKIKGFTWPKKERKRKLFDSNVEDVCIEERCTLEEMNEDYENWPAARLISNCDNEKVRCSVDQKGYEKYDECYKNFEKVSNVRSGKKTRNNIRKQCLPYAWNKVGLPTKYEEHQ